jgi:hypothetical protein
MYSLCQHNSFPTLPLHARPVCPLCQHTKPPQGACNAARGGRTSKLQPGRGCAGCALAGSEPGPRPQQQRRSSTQTLAALQTMVNSAPATTIDCVWLACLPTYSIPTPLQNTLISHRVHVTLQGVDVLHKFSPVEATLAVHLLEVSRPKASTAAAAAGGTGGGSSGVAMFDPPLGEWGRGFFEGLRGGG